MVSIIWSYISRDKIVRAKTDRVIKKKIVNQKYSTVKNSAFVMLDGKNSLGTSKIKRDFLKVTLLAMTANLPVIPSVVFAAVLYSPCLASILGYFLLPKCITPNHLFTTFQNYYFIINLCTNALYFLTCMTTVAGGIIDLTIGLMTNAFYLTESLLVYKRFSKLNLIFP